MQIAVIVSVELCKGILDIKSFSNFVSNVVTNQPYGNALAIGATGYEHVQEGQVVLKLVKNRRSSVPIKNGRALLAVLLLDTENYDLYALKRRLSWKSIFGHQVQPILIREETLETEIHDEFVTVAPMPAPFCWDELEGPCETSGHLWPDTVRPSVLMYHKSHVVVSVILGESDPITRLSILMQITGIAAELPGVSGVYWPQGTIVHFPLFFSEVARSLTPEDPPPLYGWIDFRIQQNPDGSLCLFTTGLENLGFMEIEVMKSNMTYAELRQWCWNLTHYMIDNGPVLKNGDTLDTQTGERMRIRHRPSAFGGEGTVIRIEQDLRPHRWGDVP